MIEASGFLVSRTVSVYLYTCTSISMSMSIVYRYLCIDIHVLVQ